MRTRRSWAVVSGPLLLGFFLASCGSASQPPVQYRPFDTAEARLASPEASSAQGPDGRTATGRGPEATGCGCGGASGGSSYTPTNPTGGSVISPH